MKQNFLISSLVLAFVMIMSSCGEYVYRATSVKPTFFEKEGDWDLGLNTGIGSQLELYGNYALTNNWALGAGIAGSIEIDSTRTSDRVKVKTQDNYVQNRQILEPQVFATYFQSIDPGKSFEVQFGLGLNHQKFDYKLIDKSTSSGAVAPINSSDMAYSRIFVQPTYCIKSKNAQFGVMARIEHINYNNFRNDLLIQPQLFTRFGTEKVKFMMQGGFTTCPQYKSGTNYVLINLGIGLHLTFGGPEKIDAAIKTPTPVPGN